MPRRMTTLCAATIRPLQSAAAIGACASQFWFAAASTAQQPPEYELKSVGLRGPGYAPFGAALGHLTYFRINSAGQVSGDTALIEPGGGLAAGYDTWVFDGSATHQTNLIGGAYEWNSAGVIHRFSECYALNDAGQALGVSARYMRSGEQAGADMWLWDGATTQLRGLFGAVYEWNNAGTTIRINDPRALSASGHIVGVAWRFSSEGSDRGVDAWIDDGAGARVVNPTGGDYEWNDANTPYRSGDVQYVTPAGRIVGTAGRFSPTGGYRGRDTWVSNGLQPRIVNLVGDAYQWDFAGTAFRESLVYRGETEFIMGFSRRYTPAGDHLGQDTWVSDGIVTRVAGLQGAPYEWTAAGHTTRSNDPVEGSSNGIVVGRSARFSPTGAPRGQDAWLFNGASTHLVSLTGEGYEWNNAGTIHRSAEPFSVGSGGVVSGRSWRFSSTGQDTGFDAWVFDGTQTRLIGLIGGGYERPLSNTVERRGSGFWANDSGHVAGFSDRYTPAGTGAGIDSWVFDGISTRRINPIGGLYETPTTGGATIRWSLPELINATGMVAGRSARMLGGAALGDAAWVYLPATGRTIAVIPSINPITLEAYSFIYELFETGVALGYYEKYDSSGTYLGVHHFWWSLESGAHDWSNLVSGGLTAGRPDLTGILAYSNPEPGSASPRFVVAYGSFPNDGTEWPCLLRAKPTVCYANCDASTIAPVLNVRDFVCFLNRFAAGEQYANCDASTVPPILNSADFTCFLSAFAAGCP